MNRSVAGISAAAGQVLVDYDWPGNVRELQNAIERAVLVCKTPKVEPTDLPLNVNHANCGPVGKSLAEIEQHQANIAGNRVECLSSRAPA
jgi:DNA-binding NtrC family response regulator